MNIEIGNKKIDFVYQGDDLIYPNYASPENIAVHYDFSGMENSDITKGVARDLSGNANNGVLNNFAYTAGSGYEAGGLRLDGVDDHIIVPKNSSLDCLGGITIEVLFTTGASLAPPLWNWIVMKGNSAAAIDGYGLFSNGNNLGMIGFLVNSKSMYSGVYIQPSTTYHIQVTYRADGTGEFYINNVSKASINSAYTASVSTLDIGIGTATYYQSPKMNSNFKFVRIYNKGLTPIELTQNYLIDKKRFNIID